MPIVRTVKPEKKVEELAEYFLDVRIQGPQKKVEELAEYFLDVRIQGPQREKLRSELAIHIQQAVEDWIGENEPKT